MNTGRFVTNLKFGRFHCRSVDLSVNLIMITSLQGWPNYDKGVSRSLAHTRDAKRGVSILTAAPELKRRRVSKCGCATKTWHSISSIFYMCTEITYEST